MVKGSITGRGWTVPAPMPQDTLWEDFFSRHYADSGLARRIFQRAGVERRHGVVDPREEDVSRWSTGARMRRFVQEAMPLGKEALADCMADAGLAPTDVDALTVVSCTGYATPGLDILLARDLGLRDDIQRTHIGHMGCYAAIPALATVADAAAARAKTGLMLCLELTSLHIQPAADDAEQMVAHALFSDAAAAVAVAPGTSGLQVVDVVARTDSSRSALMTWDVTDLGFRMGLSPLVPDVLAEHVVDVTAELLGRNGLTADAVSGWAIHPGGPRIVDVVAQRLGLRDEQVGMSREVLRDYGNCSSATVLLILDRMLDSIGPGEHAVAMAFGPGLTLYAALLSGA
ncbi:MAG: type III polyketide synthase [Nitriliruptorales bacterium]|nr:type III polyketide synthase [Nitriliruptorales bacterium]